MTSSSMLRTVLAVVSASLAAACGGGGGEAPPPPPACSPALSASSTSAPAAGIDGTVGVTVASGCAWTAASDAAWITSPRARAAAERDGRVHRRAEPGRRGALRHPHHRRPTFTVDQLGLGCTATLSATTAAPGAAGGVATVGVTLAGGCTWTAATAGRLRSRSGASGTGTGRCSTRSCRTRRRSPDRHAHRGRADVHRHAGRRRLHLRAPAAGRVLHRDGHDGHGGGVRAPGCAWTATSGASWLTITSGASGSGAGTVRTRSRRTPSPRRGPGRSPSGAGRSPVTQGGVACTYALAPTTASVTAAAGTGSVGSPRRAAAGGRRRRARRGSR